MIDDPIYNDEVGDNAGLNENPRSKQNPDDEKPSTSTPELHTG